MTNEDQKPEPKVSWPVSMVLDQLTRWQRDAPAPLDEQLDACAKLIQTFCHEDTEAAGVLAEKVRLLASDLLREHYAPGGDIIRKLILDGARRRQDGTPCVECKSKATVAMDRLQQFPICADCGAVMQWNGAALRLAAELTKGNRAGKGTGLSRP